MRAAYGIQRACGFLRSRPLAGAVFFLMALLLVLGIFGGRTHCRVDDGKIVCSYGIPFHYCVLGSPYYVSGLNGPPVTPPPLQPFAPIALILDLVIGASLVVLVGALIFRCGGRFQRLRYIRLRTWTLVIAVIVVGGASGFVAAKRSIERRRNALCKVEAAGSHYLVNYPLPDIVPAAVRKLGTWCRCERQVNLFLDIVVGDVVFLQAPSHMLSGLEPLPTLRALEIYDAPEVAEGHGSLFVAAHIAPHLERLDVELGYIEDLDGILHLPQLRFLRIAGQLDRKSLRDLPNIENLEALDLSECGWEGNPDAVFRKLPNLRVLRLGDAADATLQGIKHLTQLEELSLGVCPNLTDAGIKELRTLKSLQRLQFAACPQITDAALEAIGQLPALRRLDISGSSITDEGLKRVCSLTAIEELSISNTRVADKGLSTLAALPHLQTLNLSGTALSTAGVAQLSRCSALRSLDLSGTRVDNQVGGALQALTALESLNLQETNITDDGVAGLHGLQKLHKLNLSGDDVTDRCVAALLGMKSLRDLRLNGTQITRTGAVQLRGLPDLQVLKLWDCPAITQSMLAALQQEMPGVDIAEPVHSSVR